MKLLDREEQEKHLQKWVSSPEGRIAMDILKADFYDVDSFDDSALRMAKISGEREVISYLLEKQEE